MGKIRYTVTGVVDNDEDSSFDTDTMNCLKHDIQCLCEDWGVDDCEVKVEDDYCIKMNDKKKKKEIK